MVSAFPALCQAGRPPFTADEMAGAELSETELQRGRGADKARAALRGLIAEADAAARLLSRTRSSLPAEVFPAVGYATLARTALKRAGKIADAYREDLAPAIRSAQPRLVWASLTGRV